MDCIKKSRASLGICALLGGVTLAAYWPVLHNDFIKLDDYQYVVENPHVRTGLTWDNVHWAFQAGYASNWHPLTWLSHMLDVQLFGLVPEWHHLVNLLLHIANTLLVFLVFKRLTGATWRSAFVAGLFGLHPLHVESVAWIAERKDVLSTLFFLLTLWAYARYAGRAPSLRPVTGAPQPAAVRGRLDYGLALVCFALGLMSKPMLVTLPFVLLLLDFWPLKRLQASNAGTQPGGWPFDAKDLRGCILEKLPFFALAAASSIITFVAQDKGHSVSGMEGLPLEPRLANAVASYWKYLAKTVWPVDLAIFYPHPDLRYPLTDQWPDWQIGLATLALLGVSVVAVRRWRREPWLAAGWFWFLGTLVPVIGIIQVGGQAMADRYTYIPLLGIFICIAWGAGEILGLSTEQPQTAFSGPVTEPTPGPADTAASAQTQRKTKRAAQLNRAAKATGSGNLSAAPGSSLPAVEAAGMRIGIPKHRRLVSAVLGFVVISACAALTFRQVKFWKDNRSVFEHALAVTAHNPMAEYNVGRDFGESGNYDEAIAHFRAALDADPAYADAYYGLGVSLSAEGKIKEAIEQFQAAVRVKPWYAEAHNSLGAMYWHENRRADAMAEYERALELKPDNPETHYNLGIALAAQGKFQDAATHFAEAARLKPDYPEARTRLAEMMIKQGNLDAAEAAVRELAQSHPTNAAMQINLGDLLRLRHKPQQAEAAYTEALRLKPDDAQAHYDLGRLLLEQGLLGQAETHFAATVRAWPDNVPALTGLGRALAAQGKLGEAQARFREVVRLCPTNAEAQVELGNALRAAGETNESARVFAEAVRLEPMLPQRNFEAGKALLQQGQFAAAMGRLTTAVWLQPDNADAHEQLGLALAQQGKLPEAIPEFEAGLRLRPDAQGCYNLALAHVMQGKLKEAVANYEAALKLKPDWPAALNDLAWLLATAPKPEVRNGAEAVQLAERACRLSNGKEARFWGTLDAAYAEAGRFPEALSTAEKTRRLALAAAQEQVAKAAETRMELYRKQTPYHQ